MEDRGAAISNRSAALQTPPLDGAILEIWPGILWLRLSLPYRLNHVNVYLIDDGDGWLLVDTGIGDARTQQTWERLFAHVLDRPITRIIVTHFHPDHAGMAGWIAERFGIPVYMSQTEYLMSRDIYLNPGALEADHYLKFYRNHGLDADEARRLVTKGHSYLKMVRALPPIFQRLCTGDELSIGNRKFQVFTGGGHSPEQVFLYCGQEGIFFSADQVLNRISPNVSVSAIDPEGDPLGLYLRSLVAIAATIRHDALVLPGHDVPFQNLHGRVAELMAHHNQRCELILEACQTSPKCAAQLVPYIFDRQFGPHEFGFAFSEILSHVNYLLRRKKLSAHVGKGGHVRFMVRM